MNAASLSGSVLLKHIHTWTNMGWWPQRLVCHSRRCCVSHNDDQTGLFRELIKYTRAERHYNVGVQGHIVLCPDHQSCAHFSNNPLTRPHIMFSCLLMGILYFMNIGHSKVSKNSLIFYWIITNVLSNFIHHSCIYLFIIIFFFNRIKSSSYVWKYTFLWNLMLSFYFTYLLFRGINVTHSNNHIPAWNLCLHEPIYTNYLPFYLPSELEKE